MQVNLEKTDEAKSNKEKVLTPGQLVWKRLKKNKLAMLGLFILILMFIFAFVGPIFMKLIFHYTDATMDSSYPMVGPYFAHPLGTDLLGRDILTRLMYAGRISLLIGIVVVIIEIILGSLMGVIAGYYGGFVDSIIMRVVDIFLCLPYLPMLIILGAMMSDFHVSPGLRIFAIMVIIGILDAPSLSRIIRGQILALREQEFMVAAEALGLKDKRKMLKHLFPNTFPSIIVTATLDIGGAILAESALSFLGMGVMPPAASWGNMIQTVNDLYSLQYRPWLWMPPGICIFITVIAINLLGDGLRDALDPKLKQ